MALKMSTGGDQHGLREDLEAINRTARAMAVDVPGLDDKFRVPRNNPRSATY
jgi:hypothetical protein